MADNYYINGIAISQWGLQIGSIGSALNGYALSGIFSLPKRLGETHCDWQGDIEPYVMADDINLDGRDLTLNLVCKAKTAAELTAKIDIFKDELPDNFTLSHPILGSFKIGVKEFKVTVHGRIWAQVTLKLREPNPIISKQLPQPDGGIYGIDGYSWEQLGLVISDVKDMQDLPSWQKLSVTVDPRSDSWLSGYRDAGEMSIKGTVKGNSYADFKAKVDTLQALFSSAGLRAITRYDGSIYQGFCVDGFKIDLTKSGNIHWGKFDCKLILI